MQPKRKKKTSHALTLAAILAVAVLGSGLLLMAQRIPVPQTQVNKELPASQFLKQ